MMHEIIFILISMKIVVRSNSFYYVAGHIICLGLGLVAFFLYFVFISRLYTVQC